MSNDVERGLEAATAALGLVGTALAAIAQTAEAAYGAAKSGGAEAKSRLDAALANLARAEGAVVSSLVKNDAEADARVAADRRAEDELAEPLPGLRPAPIEPLGTFLRPIRERLDGLEMAMRGLRASSISALAARVAVLEAALLAADDRQHARYVDLQRGPIAALMARVAALEVLAGLGGPQPPDVVAGPAPSPVVPTPSPEAPIP